MVRLKQRYLLLNLLYPGSNATSKNPATDVTTFRAPTPDYVNPGNFVTHLRNHIALLFGDFGLGVSLASLKVVYLSAATSTIILRVPRNHHRLVWAALSHLTELPAPKKGTVGKQCVVRVVRVSGTIRKAEEELIRRAKQDMVRAKLIQEMQDRPASILPVEQNASVQMIEDLTDEEGDPD